MSLIPPKKKESPVFWILAGSILIGVIGIVDYLTGYELAFSLFYLIPVFLITWNTRRWIGILSAVVSAVIWLTADIAAGNSYPNPIIFIWNTIIRFSFFAITVILL